MTIRRGRAALGLGAAMLFAVAGTGLLAAAQAPPVQPSGSNAPAPFEAGADASVAGRVAVSPIVLRLELVPPKPKTKRLPEVRATVTNLSRARVPLLSLSVGTTPAGVVVRPPDPRIIRNLASGKSAEATWTLCSASAGTFRLVATAVVGVTEVHTGGLDVALPAATC